MNSFVNDLKKSLLMAFWMVFLTFPLMVIKVNTIDRTIEFRWMNLLWIVVGSVVLSFVWRLALRWKEEGSLGIGKVREKISETTTPKRTVIREFIGQKRVRLPAIVLVAVFVLLYPFLVKMYHTSIMITALMYVVLGLGLNIVVGFGGLLHLGYAAFYAMGAYTYALLYYYFGVGFWIALPLGGLVGAVFGLLVGFPVLRLRGDYLAIVTLAFGEITRIVLLNWSGFTKGPEGVAGIPRASEGIPGLTLQNHTRILYFIILAMVIFSIFVIRRLENSRLGRAWEAMREDEIACQSMGIDLTKTKLTAFALGAVWAGFVGVIFATKTTYVNPNTFNLWQSVLILCVVVLGGMGSIPGVIFGALLMILLPEYLRAVSEYRMLFFGAALVIMMIFRPGGFIPKVRKRYLFRDTAQSVLTDPEKGASRG